MMNEQVNVKNNFYSSYDDSLNCFISEYITTFVIVFQIGRFILDFGRHWVLPVLILEACASKEGVII